MVANEAAPCYPCWRSERTRAGVGVSRRADRDQGRLRHSLQAARELAQACRGIVQDLPPGLGTLRFVSCCRLRTLTRSFAGSLVRWFAGSLVRWFAGSLVRSLVRSSRKRTWPRCRHRPSKPPRTASHCKTSIKSAASRRPTTQATRATPRARWRSRPTNTCDSSRSRTGSTASSYVCRARLSRFQLLC